MKVTDRLINELKPADYNPRFLTKKQEDNLTESLKIFGLIDPIIINVNKERKGVVIGGHQRLKIWTKLGNKKIPCVELDLTEERERELNVRLNRNTGEFDFILLKESFDVEDLQEWGFEAFELGLDIDQEDDIGKEVKIKIERKEIAKKGDIWLLGGYEIRVNENSNSYWIDEAIRSWEKETGERAEVKRGI